MKRKPPAMWAERWRTKGQYKPFALREGMIKTELWSPQWARTCIVQLLTNLLVSFVTSKPLEQQSWPAEHKPFDRHEVLRAHASYLKTILPREVLPWLHATAEPWLALLETRCTELTSHLWWTFVWTREIFPTALCHFYHFHINKSSKGIS